MFVHTRHRIIATANSAIGYFLQKSLDLVEKRLLGGTEIEHIVDKSENEPGLLRSKD
jgi:hypothetical protein